MYDVVDKKIKGCKIYSHIFNREFDRSKFPQVNLNEDGRKLQRIFNTHQHQIFQSGSEYYRDINTIFTYDTRNKQWHATNSNFINEVNSEIINYKKLFVVSKFMKKFYVTKKKELVMF